MAPSTGFAANHVCCAPKGARSRGAQTAEDETKPHQSRDLFFSVSFAVALESLHDNVIGFALSLEKVRRIVIAR